MNIDKTRYMCVEYIKEFFELDDNICKMKDYEEYKHFGGKKKIGSLNSILWSKNINITKESLPNNYAIWSRCSKSTNTKSVIYSQLQWTFAENQQESSGLLEWRTKK